MFTIPEGKLKILGMMSGTSGDGIDGSLVEFDRNNCPELIWQGSFQFNDDQFARISSLTGHASAREVTLGSAYVAELYALAFAEFCKNSMPSPDFIAAHGQTVFHQPQPENWDGFNVAGSLQLLNGSLVAQRCNAPVICNFREADMAAGGQGAPLVPFADARMFNNFSKEDLVVVNIGGMANITAMKRCDAELQVVSAFDTGPGNILMDLYTQKIKAGRYDKDGMLAAAGQTEKCELDKLLADSYFFLKPPKSTGREYFNQSWLDHRIGKFIAEGDKHVVMSTLLDLTVDTISMAITDIDALSRPLDVIVAGGGALNQELIKRFTAKMSQDARVLTSDKAGIPVMARESMAFAILGNSFLKQIPANVISATGAREPVILGELHPIAQRLNSI